MPSHRALQALSIACALTLGACAEPAAQAPTDAEVQAAVRRQLETRLPAGSELSAADRKQWLDAIAAATFSPGAHCVENSPPVHVCELQLTMDQPGLGPSTQPYEIALIKQDGAWRAQTP